MEFIQPTSWEEALAVKAQRPDAVPVQGGTDVMVALNFGRSRPPALLDLQRVPELGAHGAADGWLRIGAGVTYARLIAELRDQVQGLAVAARTVGSPQIRNRGTIGGNLGAASPAGDCHPVLIATRAVVEVASVRGVRRLDIDDFYAGPKRSALEPDELVAAVLVEPSRGAEQFAKVGTRNAMVIAACSCAVALDPARRRVGVGIGSAGPTPLRAREAEAFLAGALTERGLWETTDVPPAPVLERFGELVAAAARPIDDVRATAAYRRHALGVLARRAVVWARNGS